MIQEILTAWEKLKSALNPAPVNEEVYQTAVTVVSKQLRIIGIQIIGTKHFKDTRARSFLGKGYQISLSSCAGMFHSQIVDVLCDDSFLSLKLGTRSTRRTKFFAVIYI